MPEEPGDSPDSSRWERASADQEGESSPAEAGPTGNEQEPGGDGQPTEDQVSDGDAQSTKEDPVSDAGDEAEPAGEQAPEDASERSTAGQGSEPQATPGGEGADNEAGDVTGGTEPAETGENADDPATTVGATERARTDETGKLDSTDEIGDSATTDETEQQTATPAEGGTTSPTEEVGEDPGGVTDAGAPAATPDVPADVQSYDKFSKIDGSTYDRANEFLRDRTYITAREWAIARLCADFRTETGVEMTKIGENLPHLVPFMTDTYSPQAVNQARHSFEEKVRKAGATFLYGAMCDFFTAEELDDVMYEATEVAKFLLEVEGVELSVEDELEAEDRITEVMRTVRESSLELRHDEVTCPECGHEFDASEK